MAPQPCKIFSTRAREILGCTISYRLIHSRALHIGGINGDSQSGLATLLLNNGEQLEFFKAEFSDFNRKFPSLDKMYLLQDFSSIILSHYQRATKSKHALRLR